MTDIYISKESGGQRTKGVEQREDVHKLSGHSHNPFAAFYYMPDNIRLETQEPEEKIILFLRKHPITNIPWILAAVALLFAPLLFFDGFPIFSFLPERFQTVAVLFWYLLTIAFILEQALSWFFNVYVITDERILDVDFYNLIYREVSDAKIDKIQDVTYKVGGVAAAIFNYGGVFIQTAGSLPNFEFLAVPNPAGVTRILQGLRTQEEQEAIEGRVR